jgi:photosystem II stability/assembly factor-like uncharacterized protein
MLILFLAAMGNPFKSNPNAVFTAQDGGNTWQLVLSKDEKRAMCVRIDPTILELFMQLWEGYRNGHSMSSGGKGSGMYKSIDGGDTWKSLNENQECQLESGKMGIAVSPVNSNRLYALIENTKVDCIDLMMQVSTGN